ncbi:hypothetical protein LAZ67_5003291 [Cordylochernes scorpioides]|uniref:Uncharacterized protein n=1 Tax=Cordylochernes scorpioides TaxID=51811 RepID=A0ABY6KH72_9ARAC|nr:hypothetical protein LAZ67_5003291 [Cordylochernes scorpioides]
MPFDVNVFSSGMINRISRQLLSTLVIRLQNSRSIQQFTKSHLIQQRSKIDCLLSCFTKCDVLRFCARKSDSLLLLRFPGYWTSCQEVNNSRMRFSIHEVSTPISVDITMKSLIRFPKTGKLPQDCKNATIIPIKKLDKSADDPKTYRPISLTNICCKLMEKNYTQTTHLPPRHKKSLTRRTIWI